MSGIFEHLVIGGGIGLLLGLPWAIWVIHKNAQINESLRPCRACKSPIHPDATRCPLCQIEGPHVEDVVDRGRKPIRPPMEGVLPPSVPTPANRNLTGPEIAVASLFLFGLVVFLMWFFLAQTPGGGW